VKVLHVINNLAGGGAEKLVSQLTISINTTNTCDVLLLNDRSDKYSESLRNNNVNIRVLNFGKYSIKNLIEIVKHININEYDVVHAHLFPTIYYVALSKWILTIIKKHKAVYFMTEHNTTNRRREKPLFKYLERFIYSLYDNIICISEATYIELTQWLRLKSNTKVATVHNGIELNNFETANAYDKKDFDLDKESIVLVMVGSFTEQKGHKVLIDAIHQLPEPFNAILVGEGGLLDEVKTYAHELDLSDRVQFLGYRSDVPQIVKMADIAVIPSNWEGFGLVAAEAMACGVPVVASNVPGLNSVVGDGGLLFDKGSAEGLRENIAKLAENRELYESVKNKAINRAKEYDIQIMIKRYMDMYSSFK